MDSMMYCYLSNFYVDLVLYANFSGLLPTIVLNSLRILSEVNNHFYIIFYTIVFYHLYQEYKFA